MVHSNWSDVMYSLPSSRTAEDWESYIYHRAFAMCRLTIAITYIKDAWYAYVKNATGTERNNKLPEVIARRLYPHMKGVPYVGT